MPPAGTGDYSWRAGSWIWLPDVSGDGWRTGTAADGVDSAGLGGGIRLGVRFLASRDRPDGRREIRDVPALEGMQWRHSFGIDFEAFGALAEEAAGKRAGRGRMGDVDLLVDYGPALISKATGRTVFRPALLLGIRGATLELEDGALAPIHAEERKATFQGVAGANLEVSPIEGVTLFGRIDWGGSGKEHGHDELSTSMEWFAGIRAGLGHHVSVEAGWRWYRLRVNREEKGTRLAGVFPFIFTEEFFFEIQRNELVASGPWVGLTFDF